MGAMNRNTNNGEEEIYNVYCLPNPKDFIMVRFRQQGDCYMADIINSEYRNLFKKCFDLKVIVLSSCN